MGKERRSAAEAADGEGAAAGVKLEMTATPHSPRLRPSKHFTTGEDSELCIATFSRGATMAAYAWASRVELLQEIRAGSRRQRASSGISSASSAADVRPQRRSVRARDIRKVDPSFCAPTDASLLVRRGCILVSMGVSCCILRDRCFFIVPQGADSIMSLIIRRLVNVSERDEIPFEFRALEATFATVVSKLESELTKMTKTIDGAIQAMRARPSDAKAQTLLYVVSGELNTFQQCVTAIASVLDELLADPEDMAYMSLTRLYELDDAAVGSSLMHHEEDVELLLENYLSAVKSLDRRSSGLISKLTSTTRIIDIELAATRNQLLRYDVGLATVSVVVAICALFAGLFGMNLPSGLEQSQTAFWAVFNVSVAVVIISGVAASVYVRHIRM